MQIICTSLQTDKHASTSARTQVLQVGGMLSLTPNCVKARQADILLFYFYNRYNNNNNNNNSNNTYGNVYGAVIMT